MSTFVIPGDDLLIDPTTTRISLGPGVYLDPKTQEIIPVNAGNEVLLDSKGNKSSNIGSVPQPSTVYIDYNSKRYIPAVGDFVVGIITGAFSDSYRVSLASFSTPVSLSYMAFPNATKKNRPNLKVGDLVYARVSNAEPELGAEIECMDSSTGQDSGFGLLEDGMVVDVTLGFARSLLFTNNHPLLKLLAQRCKFEIAIGVNGKIWIKADEVRDTLACYRCLISCTDANPQDYKAIVRDHFDQLVNTTES